MSFSAGGTSTGTGKPVRYGGKSGETGSGSFRSAKSTSEVPMIPEDYKRLPSEVFAKIKPLTDDPDTTDQDQLAARRYLADQGISLKTAMDTHIGCLTRRCFGKEKDEKKNTGTIHHSIAYVNYVNGQPINAKYRSCDPLAISRTNNSSPKEEKMH